MICVSVGCGQIEQEAPSNNAPKYEFAQFITSNENNQPPDQPRIFDSECHWGQEKDTWILKQTITDHGEQASVQVCSCGRPFDENQKVDLQLWNQTKGDNLLKTWTQVSVADKCTEEVFLPKTEIPTNAWLQSRLVIPSGPSQDICRQELCKEPDNTFSTQSIHFYIGINGCYASAEEGSPVLRQVLRDYEHKVGVVACTCTDYLPYGSKADLYLWAYDEKNKKNITTWREVTAYGICTEEVTLLKANLPQNTWLKTYLSWPSGPTSIRQDKAYSTAATYYPFPKN